MRNLVLTLALVTFPALGFNETSIQVENGVYHEVYDFDFTTIVYQQSRTIVPLRLELTQNTQTGDVTLTLKEKVQEGATTSYRPYNFDPFYMFIRLTDKKVGEKSVILEDTNTYSFKNQGGHVALAGRNSSVLYFESDLTEKTQNFLFQPGDGSLQKMATVRHNLLQNTLSIHCEELANSGVWQPTDLASSLVILINGKTARTGARGELRIELPKDQPTEISLKTPDLRENGLPSFEISQFTVERIPAAEHRRLVKSNSMAIKTMCTQVVNRTPDVDRAKP